MRRRRLVPGLLALLAAGAAGAVALPTGGGGRPRPRPRLALPTPRSLARAVTVAGVLEHMAAVERIADRNGGDRAAGRPGFDESAHYVAARLGAAGWRVSTRPAVPPLR